MEFPPYQNDFAFSLPHERFLGSCKVNEINYDLLLMEIPVLILFLSFFQFISLPFRIFTATIVFLLTTPFVFRKWHFELTNKRLVVRRWFAGLERFLSWISIKLSMIETLETSPRIKAGPLLLGYWILTSYALPLIEFGLSGEIPLPFAVKLAFFLGLYSSTVEGYEEDFTHIFIEPIFETFADVSLLAGTVMLIIGLFLFLAGLPYRKEFRLITISGHSFSVRTGLPNDFLFLLDGIMRKHHIQGEFENEVHFPKLIDEELKAKGRLGLIDRKNQLIGLLSLIMFVRGFANLLSRLQNADQRDVIFLFLNLIDFLLILFLIVFAKRFQKIWATNHRIIFQEERKGISGLWGRRIFTYRDLPFSQIQGFKVSYYSGFSPYSLYFGVGILLAIQAIATSLAVKLPSSPHFLIYSVGVIIAGLYLLLNFRTFGELTLFSLGGRVHRLRFRTPYIVSKLSHRLEGKEGLAEKFFPNLLSDAEIQKICNVIRGYNEPKRPLTKREHYLDAFSFIGKDEKILFSVEKIKPHPFYWLFAIVFILSGVTVIYVFMVLFEKFDFPSVVASGILIASTLFLLVRTVAFAIIKRKSLILTEDRLIDQSETNPTKLAKWLGYLPIWELREVRNDFVTSIRQQILFHRFRPKGIFSLVLISLFSVMIVVLLDYPYSSFDRNPVFIVLMLSPFLLISSINHFLLALMETIPRYGLKIETRKFTLSYSHFPKSKQFEQIFYQAVRNRNTYNQMIREGL
ncbi:MAG: hypothetical protein D6732_08760 [Methanobacteriota archaeon]|nr:MAG: hypothetical protein D6732_08760 [Euryarchaeota archaeon]